MKKITSLFGLSLWISTTWAQNGYAPNSYNKAELIDENTILSFFSSGSFETIMILGLGAILLLWVVYMYSSFQMEPKTDTHRTAPSNFTPRVNLFPRSMARPVMSTIPVEKKEKKKKNRRAEAPDKRGKDK